MTATSGPARLLPANPSEEHLRKEAKRLAKAKGWQVGQAQRALAHDYGFESWAAMLAHVREAVAAGGLPPLSLAAQAGDVAAVERLIAAGAPVDGTVEGLGSPLWYVCDSTAPADARLAIARRLLDAGAHPRTGTPFDKVPLLAAARRGPWAMLALLFERGAAGWQADSKGRDAIAYAEVGDAPDKAEILHKLKRPVIDDADFAAAVAAIQAGDLAALNRLLDAHPDLTERRAKEPDCYPQDYFRDPKLLWFVANNPDALDEVPAETAEITAAIVARGASQADLDYTLELLASSSPAPWRGRQAETMGVLLDAGATPTRQVILIALAHKQREPVRLMLRRGLALDAVIAAGLGETQALPTLLADASQADKQAALSMAVVNGEHEAARLALAAGAEVNARMVVHKHATPAHSATADDDVDMLKLLVEHGARLDVADDLWRSTPAGWARFMKQPKCEAYLASLTPA